MAIASSSRLLWISGAAILVFLWYLLQSSSLSNRTTPVRQALISSIQSIEHATGDHGLHEAERTKQPNEECPICPKPAENISPAGNAIGKVTQQEDRPLILYAYYESEFGQENLQFFVDHGLHAAADFVFIINGPSDVDETIIFKEGGEGTSPNRDKSNIMVKKRENTCFDLGAHAEVLNGTIGGPGWIGSSGPIASLDNLSAEGQETQVKRPLKERYKRYILMNASIRGPFVPIWSKSCWSDAYLDKVTDKVKVIHKYADRNPHLLISDIQMVGMSYNCHTDRGHVQSMIWATDAIGLGVILSPEGVGECFANMPDAQNGEIRTTQLLRDRGYDVDVFLSVYHSKDVETKQHFLKGQDGEGRKAGTDSVPGDFWKSCTDEDWLSAGAYFGTFVHPYENLFMKSHRHIDDTVLDRLTEWHNGWGYSSYDVCF